jgi:hypothetical protein
MIGRCFIRPSCADPYKNAIRDINPLRDAAAFAA